MLKRLSLTLLMSFVSLALATTQAHAADNKVASDGAQMQTTNSKIATRVIEGGTKIRMHFKEENVHYGWLNGDIDFAQDSDYFTILFEDEKNSEQYGHQINIGKIDCELSVISGLQGSFDVRIELAN